jgi:hypothetical protein
MYVKPNAPRSIGGVLDDGIKLYRDSFSRCWPLTLSMSVLTAAPMLLVAGKLAAMAAARANPQAALGALGSPGVWLAYLVALIVTVGFYCALFLALDGYATSRPISFGEAAGGGFRLMPRTLLLGVLFVLVVGGFGLAAGLVSALIGVGLAAALGGAATKIISFVLMTAIFLGAFYVFGRLFLAIVALVVDDASASSAIGISWKLTAGNWWRAGTIYLVSIAILLALYLIADLVNGGLMLIGSSGPFAVVLQQIVRVLLGVLVASFQPAILLSMYYDLKLRKGGADLADRMNALATP